MLFTKECDYAIRIMRALSDGELVSVSNICAAEQLPSAMTYKITRKLEKQGLLKSCRGTNGGYCLNRTLSEISLYDICAAVDPDILLLECMKDGYHCSMNNQQKPCLVHREFCRLQSMLLQEMRQKSLSELFSDNLYTRKMCQAYFSGLIFTILVKFKGGFYHESMLWMYNLQKRR